MSHISGSNPAGTLQKLTKRQFTQPLPPLEHLHVDEDGGDDEEDAHEDDVVGVDLMGGGRERGAVPPVRLPFLAVAAVKLSPLPSVYRPENTDADVGQA